MRSNLSALVCALAGAFLLVAGCEHERSFSEPPQQGGEAGMDATNGDSGSAGAADGEASSASGGGGRGGAGANGGNSGSSSNGGSPSNGGSGTDPVGGTNPGAKSNGLACVSNAECESALCQDEVCCDRACDGTCEACVGLYTGLPNGTCGPALAGSDPHDDCEASAPASCGTDGSCDGAGACRLFGSNEVCAEAGCNGSSFTPVRTCDGEGSCQAAAPVACGQNPCTDVGCQQPCSADPDCPTGSYCDEEDQTCHNQQTDGQACTADNQCRSGFCIDKVCCENECEGACSACSKEKTGQSSGRCVGIPAGEDPDDECAADTSNACGRDGECTGGGACRVRSVGTACGTATCSGDTLTPEGSCNGASTCSPTTATACPDNLTCASASACRTSCSSDSHCRSGYYCAGNSCAPTKGKGAGCSSANECTSGFCKDQVCCDAACSLSCQGCTAALTGLSNGTCGQKASDVTMACPVNAPTSCAAVSTDLNNCGTCGTVCPTVANQTPSCEGGTCKYACSKTEYTASCSPSSNQTTCTNWGFEVSGSTDGWFLVPGSNGSNGALSSSNRFASTGSRSLAIPYTNAGSNPDNGDRRYVDVAVKVCANGGKINLSNKFVRWNFRMDPPAPSQGGYNYFSWWSEASPTSSGGGTFDFNPVTTAGWWSSSEYYTNPLGSSTGTAATIGFHFEVDGAWTGTIFLDDVEIY